MTKAVWKDFYEENNASNVYSLYEIYSDGRRAQTKIEKIDELWLSQK